MRETIENQQSAVDPDLGRALAYEEAGQAPALGSTRRRYEKLARFLAASDALCFSLALFLSYLVRFGVRPLPLDWLITALVAPAVWVLTFRGFRLHAPQYLSSWEEFTRTISASSIGIIIIALLSYWSKSSFSRAWVGLTWLSALFLELLSRRIWRWYIGRRRAAGDLSYRTLVVGDNAEGIELLDALRDPTSGFTPLECVAVAPSLGRDAPPERDELASVWARVRDLDVECVFIASTAVDNQQIASIMQTARRLGIEVRVSTNLPEMAAPRLTVQQLGNLMTLALKPVHLSGAQAFLKRSFDIVIAGVGLVLLSPVLCAIAALIRIESPGGIIFRQKRVTKGGRVFTMLKFRTMWDKADELLDPDEIDLSSPFFKLEDDPRLTKVGRFIRKWSLDELPQLWNVVRGDMSLVGPRPLPIDQVVANAELLEPRHEVAAGITGWWQINGRSMVAADEAIRMDLFYIENWSLALDVYVLLKTVGAIVTKKGAY